MIHYYFRSISVAVLFAFVQLTVTGAAHAQSDTSNIEIHVPTDEEFANWLDDFRNRALEQGFSEDLLSHAFDGVRYNSRVVELDRFQPEFVRPVWDYLRRAVSAERIATGRAMALAFKDTLQKIAAEHGVPPEILLAIWGIESSYGTTFGDYNVFEALATLAFDGRRREFIESELFAALRILSEEQLDAASMRGSWAGAMGHTQFIPSSYLNFAVDFDGNNSRDLWSSNPADALASAANYLAKHGWIRDARWGAEVRLPEEFNYHLTDLGVQHLVAKWHELGVKQVDGSDVTELGEDAQGSLLVPAGIRGPAFLILENFRALLTYNFSTAYALAVAHLSDRIQKRGEFMSAWPTSDGAVRSAEVLELQELLTRLGYDTKGIDGIVGPATRAAVRAFQERIGQTPDGYVSPALLNAIREVAAES